MKQGFKRRVRVADTDLTKALYFTSQLRFVQQAFEEYLTVNYPDVARLFLEQKIAMPIVHTSSNFLLPIFAGNELEIRIELEFGKASYTVKGMLVHEGKEKGNVVIKHACINLKTKKSISSKDLFHGLLEF
ncbi:acyl-CoA thioesterase [bacterium]|nr:acyl-CoA thioesterase [bacterium]